MHHGFIDKIWYDWQKKSAVNKYAHFLNINQKLQASPYYPRDFIDIADQPKCVKVCYAEPRIHKAKIVRQYLSGKLAVQYNNSVKVVANYTLDFTILSLGAHKTPCIPC